VTTANAYSPAAPEVQECPYPYYELLRDERVHRIEGTNHYVVARYEDAVRVSRHPELFSNRKYWQSDDDPDLAAILAEQRYPIEPALVDNDPPEHTVYRRIASRAFTPARLREVEPSIRAICEDLVDRFAGRGEVEFISEFCRPLPMRVTCSLIGLPLELSDRIGVWADSYNALATRQLPKERALVAQRHVVDFNNYLADVLEERRARPGGDVISELTQAATPEGLLLDFVELSGIVRNLVAAAPETTRVMLGITMLQLLEHPDELERVTSDRSLIPRLVEESLRHDSPQQWNWRQVLRDVDLGGVAIPAGSWLHVVWGSANRDPAVFDEPDRFAVSRPNSNRQLAFGSGIHFCLGAPLARMEGRVAFETLLARLANLRLAEGDAIQRHLHPTLRALGALRLRFDPESATPA
jgi:cytochrome P450